MTFHWPHAFWLLLLPAIFVLAEIGRRVRTAVRRHPKILRAEASPSGLRYLGHEAAASTTVRVRWRLWLGLALVITAFARPEYGEIEEPVFEQSREILIAIDLSRSMLAPDVAPTRLDRSKLLTTSLLDGLKGERVGLIVFAGTAFLQCPLSADYEILEDFLPSLSPDFLPEGGTNYAALLDTALEAFSNDSGADRYLIILSDGESQSESWQDRVPELRERGIHVLGLGVGTPDGAMLPDGAGAFVKDERGAVVLSRLNSATLEDLARRTSGIYENASSWVDIAALLQKTVETGKQGEFSEKRSARKIERFQWALAPAILFLLWSVWREFPVQPRHRAVTIKAAAKNARRAAVALLFAALCLPGPTARAVEKVDPSGNKIDDPNGILQPVSPSPGRAGPPGPPTAANPAPPPPPEAPVREVVARLSGLPQVSASEFAELASETLTYGQKQKSSGQKFAKSAVYDALDAVDAGENLDPKAADWPALRDGLKKLLEDDPKQDQQNKDQDKNQDQQDQDQDQQNQDQQNGGDGQQDQQNGDQGKQDDQQQNGQQGDQGDQQQQGQQGDGDQKDQQGKQGDGQDQEGKEGQDQQNKDPAGGDDSGDQQPHQPPENRQSAFGDLDDQQKPQDGDQQPQPAQPQQGETQKIGGQPTQRGTATDDPTMAIPLQKLDQLKQKDSPAQLFQLMQDPAKATPKTGRDW